KLITNFTEFKTSFGDFSEDADQSILAHAVYGFFNNGGTRCYVTRLARATTSTTDAAGVVTTTTNYSAIVDISDALELLEPIEEIAIVAAPGFTDDTHYAALAVHCGHMETRFAILDTPRDLDAYTTALAKAGTAMPATTDTAAVYFPWVEVFDKATDATKYVPPSGHIAGLYARVDAARGVHKAPANEVILGAVGLRYAVSPRQQDGLNPHGVNVIRKMNGAIRVWGARTVGGDANTEFKYVSVRRLFNYLHGSIDQGTQWAVFEPNDAALWAKITRNVSAFLKGVWESGALFGEKQEDAFYVKCDAETNPPEVRDLGQVITEIGVAITKPAEFVIFRLGQKTSSS
ncbi:MAG TPA: phage tail sheath subtilisin-like domain-containing protein, partial [Polyangiaceae bacterium]|nr:phage tail sheath subtilisin-like domain-containing protein [Polyangiaceae bacterium]